MKKILIGFGLCLLLVLTIGAGYKFYLSDYQEVCYIYKTENYVANFSYRDWKDENKCINSYNYWGLNCSIVTKYYFYNATRNTDKCAVYHIVRYAK